MAEDVRVTLNSNIPQFLRDLYNAVAEETERQANELLRQSQEQVPVNTGELRDSGYVKINKTSDSISAEIGYTAPHAIYVHEDRQAQHDNGKAGFLGDVYKQTENTIINNVGNAIKRTTK